MNKLTSGHGKTELRLTHLQVYLNGREACLSLKEPIWIKVDYYHETYIPATEDEPEEREYLAINEALTTEVAQFHGDGCSLVIGKGVDLLNFLHDYQYEDLCIELAKQSKGYVEPIKYVDPDSERPAVSKRMQEQLGFGLISKYEREDL